MKLNDIIINNEILFLISGYCTIEDIYINEDFNNMIPENYSEKEAIEFIKYFYLTEIEHIDDQYSGYDAEDSTRYYDMIIKYNNEYYMIPYYDCDDSYYQTDVETLADCKKCKPELVIKYFAI